MKRLLASATAAAVLLAGTGSGAHAQDARRIPLFELGVNGGGAWSSNWFNARNTDDGYSVGFAPTFGANATFWATPALGFRVNGQYMPSGFPEASDQSVGETGGSYPLNNWFVDLDLMIRPWMTRSGVLGSAYAFIGGGALITNPAGATPTTGSICMNAFRPLGTCLSQDPDYGTVGQGVVGIGADLFPLGPLGVYIEGAVHGYDSPTHSVVDEDDKFAWTPRAVVGLKLGFGNIAPAPVPVPVAPTPPPPPPAPPAPPAPATQAISVCVVQGGALQTVSATYDPATGDTTVSGGGRFSTAYPATAPSYAAGATWFINTDTVTFGSRQYVKFGVTRVIPSTQLTAASGTVQGTNVFTESGAASPAQVIYVPVRPGCEFQPYQLRTSIRPRG